MQNKASEFEFTSYALHPDRKSASFVYSTIFSSGDRHTFEEKILLPEPIASDIPNDLLTNILFSLHLILGISYYKMHCANKITVRSGDLSKDQAYFWDSVYTKGLGEFFYRNQIDFRNLVRFPHTQNKASSACIYKRSDRSLLGIGGGKDSLVSYEILRKAKKSFTPLVIESNHPYPLIDQMLAHFNMPSMKLTRKIDEVLLNVNPEKTALNGHIPISAINAFIGVFVCVIYDYRYFIVSNEKSANFGNVDYLGIQVNHQWSKSSEFERLFQAYVKKYITPNITYFSLLRPFSELAIVKFFSLYKQYFSYFSSCNTNFKVRGEVLSKKWCGACPKCAFVFSLLSAFLPKKVVVEMIGRNLFDDEKMSTLYRQLWGTYDIKPFECVGTPEEVKAAFYISYKRGEYKNDFNMQLFEKEILPSLHNTDFIVNLLKQEKVTSVPYEFESIVSQLPV